MDDKSKNPRDFNSHNAVVVNYFHGPKLSRSNILVLKEVDTFNFDDDDESSDIFSKQTIIERVILTATTWKTLLIFFVVLYSIPAFIDTSYRPYLNELRPFTKTFQKLESESRPLYLDILGKFARIQNGKFDQLVLMKSHLGFMFEDDRLSKLRDIEIQKLEIDGYEYAYNFSKTISLYASCSLGAFIFMTILIAFFVIYIQRDLQKFVIQPLEFMYMKVMQLKKDPMSITDKSFDEKQAMINQALNKKSKKEVSGEIEQIDKSVSKIAYLMAVMYGEAGTNLIIRHLDTSKRKSKLNGEKIIGILGICDIRNFTDATEVLQTGVLAFTNKLAAIIHTNIFKTGGSLNQNIGDAFVFCWKICSFTQDPVYANHLNEYLTENMSISDEERLPL